MEDPTGIDRAQLLRRAGLGAAALSLPAGVLASGAAAAGDAASAWPKHPKWRFVFVNHVTTNPFFVPTQYGAADACALLGASFQWTGSKDSVVAEMVNATNAAVSAKADGIAIAVTDAKAFATPVDKALDAGIPVVSYNADGK